MEAELIERGKTYYYHWNIKRYGLGGEYNEVHREKSHSCF